MKRIISYLDSYNYLYNYINYIITEQKRNFKFSHAIR